MPQHTYTVVTSASPEAAFDFLADLRNTERWVPRVDHVELRTGGEPIGQGTRFDVHSRALFADHVVDYEIERFEPPSRIVWRARADALKRAVDSYELSPAQDGGTEVVYHSDFEAAGLLGKLGTPITGLLLAATDKSITDKLTAELDNLA